MNTPFTPARIIRWSIILTGGLVIITLAVFFSIRQITHRIDQATTTLAQQRSDQSVATRAATRIKQHGPVATTLAPLLPDETDQPKFYQRLESLASQNNVTLQYNVGRLSEQDPLLLEALAAPNQWVIPVDFLGERTAVERLFSQIETGPYILRIHAYRFDISDPLATQLSTLLILYGRTNP